MSEFSEDASWLAFTGVCACLVGLVVGATSYGVTGGELHYTMGFGIFLGGIAILVITLLVG